MRRFALHFILGMLICSTVMLVGCTTAPPPRPPGGYQGRAFEREPDGGIGPSIPGVEIIFVKEDGSVTRTVETDSTGSYRVSLSQGRYRVTATHPDYEDYSSAPAFSVATGEGYQTGNIFLRRPRVTTVLLVRHADRNNGSLSDAGKERAKKLADVALNAGVTAIYATNYTRTKETAQPLADALKLVITEETSVETLVNELILTQHRGDVVLVVSHSGSFGSDVDFSSVPKVIEALGASDCQGVVGNEYDNLYVVSRAVDDASKTNVVNLQYGLEDEPEPDHPKDSVDCMNHMITILLVPYAEPGDPGEVRGNKLAHVVQKAGVTGIYSPSPAREPIKSLASELGLKVRDIDDMPLDHLEERDPSEVFVVAGDKSAMSEIITELGGSPYPPIFPNEHDSLFVLTLLEPGDTRVLSLQYGEPSPASPQPTPTAAPPQPTPTPCTYFDADESDRFCKEKFDDPSAYCAEPAPCGRCLQCDKRGSGTNGL